MKSNINRLVRKSAVFNPEANRWEEIDVTAENPETLELSSDLVNKYLAECEIGLGTAEFVAILRSLRKNFEDHSLVHRPR